MKLKTKFLAVAALAASLVATTIGCGGTSQTPLIVTLEAISVAADVGAPVLAALSPATAGFVALIPGIVTAALDVAEGKQPLSTASTVAGQLQSVFTQGSALLTTLSATEKGIVQGILSAIQSGISLWNQTYGTTTTQADFVARGYTNGFFTTPNPQTAKVKKLNAKDKAAIARARVHIAKLEAAIAARKAGK